MGVQILMEKNGFLKCTNGEKTKNPKVWKTSKERIILL